MIMRHAMTFVKYCACKIYLGLGEMCFNAMEYVDSVKSIHYNPIVTKTLDKPSREELK